MSRKLYTSTERRFRMVDILIALGLLLCGLLKDVLINVLSDLVYERLFKRDSSHKTH